MTPDERQLQIIKLKKSIQNDLDELWECFEKDEPYYADVEMYENALTSASTSIDLANKYYGENKKLKEEIARLEKRHWTF